MNLEPSSKMDTTQNQPFLTAVLRVLNANHTGYSLTVPAVCHLVERFGFPDATDSETEDALDCLERRNLIFEVPNRLNPADRLWRITRFGTARPHQDI